MVQMQEINEASRFKLSINQCCNPTWQLDEALYEYSRWGVKQIGLWRHQLSRFGIEKSIDIIQETGLEITSISWIGGFTGAFGQSYEQAIHDAHQWLWIAREIKAKTLVIKTGSLNGHIQSHAKRLVSEGLKRLLPKAERHNIQLSLMPVDPLWSKEWSFISQFEEAQKLIRACPSSHLGICFNTFHLISEKSPVIDWQEFSQCVNLIQLSDRNLLSSNGPHGCLPGTGGISIYEFLDQLNHSDSACPVELHIEQGNDQQASLDVDYYLKFVRNITESFLAYSKSMSS